MELRRVAPVVGLGALLVVDAALITWALRPAPAEVAEAASGRASASPGASSDASTPAGRASASPSPDPADVEVVPLTRVVAAAGDDVVWVADSGTCRKPGTVWVSGDRGASWTVEDAPGQVLRVRAESHGRFVTGGDEDAHCGMGPRRRRGGVGRSLVRRSGVVPGPEGAPNRRHLDRRSGHPVPGQGRGRRPRPDRHRHRARALRQRSGAHDDRRRLGLDGRVELEGSLALALAPDASAALLVTTSDGCDGVVATPVRNGEPADDGVCIESRPRSGEVAAATSGSRWWVVVDDEVFSAAEPEGPWRATKASLEAP